MTCAAFLSVVYYGLKSSPHRSGHGPCSVREYSKIEICAHSRSLAPLETDADIVSASCLRSNPDLAADAENAPAAMCNVSSSIRRVIA